MGSAKEAHPNHENTGAAVLAVVVNQEGVWWAGTGNVALWHWRRQGGALRALGRVHEHELSHKTPGQALTGMPAEAAETGRETDVAAGDMVIATTSGARTLNELQLGEAIAAAARRGDSVADAIVEAVLEAGESAQNNCTAAVLEIARAERRERRPQRTMIAGDRKRGRVTVGGHELKLPAELAVKGRRVRFAWGYSGSGPKGARPGRPGQGGRRGDGPRAPRGVHARTDRAAAGPRVDDAARGGHRVGRGSDRSGEARRLTAGGRRGHERCNTKRTHARLPLDARTWHVTRDGDPSVVALYARHYSARRYGDGRPRRLVVGPGERVVLITPAGDAVLVWRRFRSPRPARARRQLRDLPEREPRDARQQAAARRRGPRAAALGPTRTRSTPT